MFSVLLSVYKGEKVSNFIESLESILRQSLLPSEIIIIRDGQVYLELQNTIDSYLFKYSALISYYPFDENKGLGNALNFGVSNSKNKLIIRMDTDDICEPDRFQKQIDFMKNNPDISVSGGQIFEFVVNSEDVCAKREVPISYDEIKKFIKTRNPFNHMTVIFRRDDVINAGNYIELHYLEDYFLWCRMLKLGYTFANLNDVLVRARVNENMYKRRGGIKYYRSWKKLEKYKLENGITNSFTYCSTLMIRFTIQVLLPNRIRGIIFKKFGRRR